MLKKLLILSLSMLQGPFAVAQVYDTTTPQTTSGNEFFVGREYGKPLVKVNLISGVQKPGVYHVPVGSDLAEVIAYAGGASEKADLADIRIVRVDGSHKSSMEVDLDKRLNHPEQIPTLVDQDIVRIPVDRSMDRTMNWVAIISGLASVALAASIIHQNQKN